MGEWRIEEDGEAEGKEELDLTGPFSCPRISWALSSTANLLYVGLKSTTNTKKLTTPTPAYNNKALVKSCGATPSRPTVTVELKHVLFPMSTVDSSHWLPW